MFLPISHGKLTVSPLHKSTIKYLLLFKQSGLRPLFLRQKFWKWGINPHSNNSFLPPVGQRLALSEVEGSRTTASCLLPLLIVLSSAIVTTNSQALAHTVKISADVGGTVHLEPNDNPRAGEATQAWFALVQKGGKVIPLKDCNCRLAIYAEPHAEGEPALLEPPLQPIQAERYEGIPGAKITFPKPGAYQLQLSGKPINQGSFQPFELKFPVTVATGKTVDSLQAGQNVNGSQQGTTIGFVQPLIWLGILLLSGGMVVFWMQMMKKS